MIIRNDFQLQWEWGVGLCPRKQRLEERERGRTDASRGHIFGESSYKKALYMMGPPKARMKKLPWPSIISILKNHWRNRNRQLRWNMRPPAGSSPSTISQAPHPSSSCLLWLLGPLMALSLSHLPLSTHQPKIQNRHHLSLQLARKETHNSLWVLRILL